MNQAYTRMPNGQGVVLRELAKKIKEHGFNLRLSVNLTDYFNKYVGEAMQFFVDAKELFNPNQITLRILYKSDEENEQAKWVAEHACKSKIVNQLIEDAEALNSFLIQHEFSREKFISQICDYLAAITRIVLFQKEAILITVGGETSYKCCQAIGSKNLELLDTVAPAIALGKDHKGQFIVTKSGNLGTQNTIIDIVRYFEQDK